MLITIQVSHVWGWHLTHRRVSLVKTTFNAIASSNIVVVNNLDNISRLIYDNNVHKLSSSTWCKIIVCTHERFANSETTMDLQVRRKKRRKKWKISREEYVTLLLKSFFQLFQYFGRIGVNAKNNLKHFFFRLKHRWMSKKDEIGYDRKRNSKHDRVDWKKDLKSI